MKGYVYYQLVESYRDEAGTPRVRVLKHLGKEIPADLRHLYQKKGKQLPLME